MISEITEVSDIIEIRSYLEIAKKHSKLSIKGTVK